MDHAILLKHATSPSCTSIPFLSPLLTFPTPHPPRTPTGTSILRAVRQLASPPPTRKVRATGDASSCHFDKQRLASLFLLRNSWAVADHAKDAAARVHLVYSRQRGLPSTKNLSRPHRESQNTWLCHQLTLVRVRVSAAVTNTPTIFHRNIFRAQQRHRLCHEVPSSHHSETDLRPEHRPNGNQRRTFCNSYS